MGSYGFPFDFCSLGESQIALCKPMGKKCKQFDSVQGFGSPMFRDIKLKNDHDPLQKSSSFKYYKNPNHWDAKIGGLQWPSLKVNGLLSSKAQVMLAWNPHIIYRQNCTSQVLQDFWTINSMSVQMGIDHDKFLYPLVFLYLWVVEINVLNLVVNFTFLPNSHRAPTALACRSGHQSPNMVLSTSIAPTHNPVPYCTAPSSA